MGLTGGRDRRWLCTRRPDIDQRSAPVCQSGTERESDSRRADDTAADAATIGVTPAVDSRRHGSARRTAFARGLRGSRQPSSSNGRRPSLGAGRRDPSDGPEAGCGRLSPPRRIGCHVHDQPGRSDHPRWRYDVAHHGGEPGTRLVKRDGPARGHRLGSRPTRHQPSVLGEHDLSRVRERPVQPDHLAQR